MIGGQIEVLRRDGRWVVERVFVRAEPRVLGKFRNQACAREAGKAVARDSRAEYVGKNRRGEIVEKNSYGSDPSNIPG